MAESMTYTSLIGDIQDYAERDDTPFVAQIPRFVMMAENRLASEVHTLGQLKTVTGNLLQGSPVLQKPALWRETESFFITVGSEKRFLKQRSKSFLDSYWPDVSISDIPLYYSDYGYEHFLVVATPDSDYDFQLGYYERPAPLDSTNQTNWTTQYAPQLLLYASLLEAQPYLKLPMRTQEFQTLYDRAVAAVQNESQRRLMGDQTQSRTTA